MKLQTSRYVILLIAFNLILACTSQNLPTENGKTNSREEKPSSENNMQLFFGSNSYNEIRLGDAYNEGRFKKISEELDGCFNAMPINYNNIIVTVEDGIITELSTEDPAITSYDNLKVGDPLSMIQQKIDPNKLEIIENHDTALPAFIRWHDSNKTIGTRYSTDDGVSIHYIDMGYHDRMYLMEGCA